MNGSEIPTTSRDPGVVLWYVAPSKEEEDQEEEQEEDQEENQEENQEEDQEEDEGIRRLATFSVMKSKRSLQGSGRSITMMKESWRSK